MVCRSIVMILYSTLWRSGGSDWLHQHCCDTLYSLSGGCEDEMEGILTYVCEHFSREDVDRLFGWNTLTTTALTDCDKDVMEICR